MDTGNASQNVYDHLRMVHKLAVAEYGGGHVYDNIDSLLRYTVASVSGIAE